MFNFSCKILQHPKINPGSAPAYLNNSIQIPKAISVIKLFTPNPQPSLKSNCIFKELCEFLNNWAEVKYSDKIKLKWNRFQ